MEYRFAGLADLDLLVQSRVATLRAANRLSEELELHALAHSSALYYRRALVDSSHPA